MRGRVYPGCHSLQLQLVRWDGDGDDAKGKRCDFPLLTNPKCDPFFYVCVDKREP